MNPLLNDLRREPMLWLLAAVPVLFVVEASAPEASNLLFVLSILSIVPLALLLSRATESVAARTGDTVGGLINATLGNLVELVIALAALRAGEHLLVKATLAGVIVTNALFMLGASFLVGGLRHHLQEFNAGAARMQAAQLFLATIALLIPSVAGGFDALVAAEFTSRVSLGLAVLLAAAYGLGLLFSLGTHRDFFAGAGHDHAEGEVWPIGLALSVLAVVAVLVAFASEIFVHNVQVAASSFGMSRAFVGFIIVPLVGGAAEMAAAFSAARKDRLDISVGIALGSATQVALFVAPLLVFASYLLGPGPMDLQFWPAAVGMMLIAALSAAMVSNSGRSAWYNGVLVLAVFMVFAVSLYLIPSTPVAAAPGAGH